DAGEGAGQRAREGHGGVGERGRGGEPVRGRDVGAHRERRDARTPAGAGPDHREQPEGRHHLADELAGAGEFVSEVVATFGLLSVIWACARRRPSVAPFAVGAYITAAYWFTASTSFANPAVTFARTLTSTFAGIRAADAPAFVAAQVLGAGAATVLFRWLLPIE